MLYIVATPIGNLKDITLRAVEVLKSVDLIACEDTRHSRILLKQYNINKPTTSYFQHNKVVKARYLINLLKEGKSIALISDAGTPGILDPGHYLIRQAIENNIPVTAVPGACAFVAALSISGKPTHSFTFAGFLPKKSIARKRRLEELASFRNTIIFYESPYRILATLKDLQEVLGDVQIVVARELSKKFEEILRGKVSRIIENLSSGYLRGEFVVVA
jgi:16S rRNA (cytidine1402-2'-O)-methyltransferase